MTMRFLLSLSLLTSGLAAHAESCADAYERASEKYVSKMQKEEKFAAGMNSTARWAAGLGTWAGCSFLTGGWGVAFCLVPAGGAVYVLSNGPRTAYLEPQLQLHLVNLIYEQSKQESTEGSRVVHALAEATGWPESEVVAEVARHMRAGDLCQAGEPSVGFDELATELKR